MLVTGLLIAGAASAQTVNAPTDNNSAPNRANAYSAAGTLVNITAVSTVTGNSGNLSIGKTATASSVEGQTVRPASAAIDGNTTDTRWASDYTNSTTPDAQWIYVDLGATYNINEVKLYWETAYGKSYTIQTSSNLTNWTDIYSTTTGAGGTEDLTGLSGSGRYVRMNGTLRGTGYGYSLWEFQIYGYLPVTYALSTNPGSYFAISSTSGVVSLSSASVPPGTYTIGVTATSGTVTSAASSYTITVYPATPTIAATAQDCSTSAVTLTASGGNPTGGTYTWYNAASGGTALATGNTYAATASGTYYVSYTSGGVESARSAGTAVTVNPASFTPQTAANGAVYSYPFSGNANDAIGTNTGTVQGAAPLTTGHNGVSNSAYSFNGSSQYISTATQIASPGPQTFTISLWFNTTTTSGGKLIGYGNSQTGASSNYDRHIYMNNAGQLYFGVYNGGDNTINTSTSYNDGKWHQVIATLSLSGVKLYVDGSLKASNTSYTAAEAHPGYWHIGYDNLNTWPSAPSSFYFAGSIDDVLIYNRELSATEIYNLQGARIDPVCIGNTLTLSALTQSGASYSWTGPNSFTSTLQNPTIPNVTAAAAGAYTVTVTNSAGCSSTATATAILYALPSSALSATSSVKTGEAATVTFTPVAGTTYTWDFGGGTPSATSPASSPFTVKWYSSGTKTITLTVTNSTTGCSSVYTTNVTVGSAYSSYAYSMPLTLKTTGTGSLALGSDLTNFPFLISITSSYLAHADNSCSNSVQFPNGPNYDFAFVDPNYGEVPYQVDSYSYNSTTGTLLVWVKIPTLSHTANNTLTFYFGSTTANTGNVPSSVWANVVSTSSPQSYKGVWHFNEVPSTSTATLLDATTNGIALKAYNSNITQNSTAANQKIGNGIQSSGGSNVSATIPTTAGYPALNTALTMSVWAKYTTTPTTSQNIMVLNGSSAAAQIAYRGSTQAAVTNFGGSIIKQTTAGYDNSWHHLVYTYDGTTSKLYVDGALPANSGTAAVQTAVPTSIFFGDYGNGNTESFIGYIDEARVINTTLSADWIAAEYKNQSAPATYITVPSSPTIDPTNILSIPGGVVYTYNGGSTYVPNVSGVSTTPSGNGKENFVINASITQPAVASTYGITVNSGATYNLGGYTTNVGCNIINNGTITGTTSTINFNGTMATQTYTGASSNLASIGNITVNNTAPTPGTITITNGKMDVYNQLTLTSGNLVVDNAGGGTLTLKSTASKTAAVAPITNTAYTIKGLINVERFLTGGNLASNRNYRLLSSPVNQTSTTASTSNTIDLGYLNGLTTTGSGAFTAGSGDVAGGFSAYNATPTIYLYKENVATNNLTFTSGKNIGVTYINRTSTSPTTNTVNLSNGNNNVGIPVGTGYLMYFVGPSSRVNGSASVTPADATLTSRGYLNQGDITVSIWWSGLTTLSYASPTGTQGLNLVGNPYASTIDLNNVFAHNSGIANAYILTRANQTYATYSPAGSSSPASNLRFIASGEGFMVQANGAGQTLTFKETDKASATQLASADLVMGIPKQDAPVTGLYMKLEKDSTLYDYCGIYFRNDWANKFDANDALDLDGAAQTVNISSYSADGKRTSINRFTDYSKPTTIRLYTDATSSGLYTLKLEGIRNIDTLYDIWLRDKYKKDSLDIRRYGAYKFNVIRSDTASYGGNRFELVIRMRPLPKYQLLSFAGQKAENAVKLTWKVQNEGTYTGFALQKQDGSKTYLPLYQVQSNGAGTYSYVDQSPVIGSNNYRLSQNDVNGVITYSDEVNVTYLLNNSDQQSISLYPNPANANINIAVNLTQTSATYTVKIFDNSGTKLMQQEVSGNNWSQNVGQLKPGMYYVEIRRKDGTLAGKTKFIKN